MQRNGPIALAFHSLVVVFMLAPMVVVCLVAFTPENTLGPIVVLSPRVVLAWKAGSYETAKQDDYPLASSRFVF